VNYLKRKCREFAPEMPGISNTNAGRFHDKHTAFRE